MKDARKPLAFIIVGTWSVSILLILILLIFNLIEVGKGQEILKTFSSVSSGFVGMVFGYYFSGRDKSP
jgi:hypothetical protein